YNFVVPAGTAAGTVATFNGDVGLIANGLEFRPQGYFQINTTPSATGGLTISPASATMPVGGTQQFTVTNAPSGSTVNWSVTGGQPQPAGDPRQQPHPDAHHADGW